MRRLARWIPALLLVFLLQAAVRRAAAQPETAKRPPNIVVILTDDQRWDTLWAMPLLKGTLGKRGVTFTNAFVSTPLCCPFRATFLSGGYLPQRTGVFANGEPLGGERAFDDSRSLATALKSLGYRTGYASYHTGLFGKYLNGYEDRAEPYVPPGWDRWIGLPEGEFRKGDWFGFSAIVGGSVPARRERVKKYMTDYLRDEALAFLDANAGKPFFLYFAPMAPHEPADAPAEDAGKFDDFRYRGRAFDAKTAPEVDQLARAQLRSLQPVDRAVDALIGKLAKLGELDRTVLVFTSDNGLLWGEHGLTSKNEPYEEAIRVPLIIAAPGAPAREESGLVDAGLDVPATLLELAGLPSEGDGRSLAGALLRGEPVSRDKLLIQGFTKRWWTGVREKRWKLVRRAEGGELMFDLEHDPFERSNLALDARAAQERARIEAELDALMPLSIADRFLPAGAVGKAYSRRLTPAHARARVAWRLLPEGRAPGLSLSRDGVLGGVPRQAGRYDLFVEVAESTATARPQIFRARLSLAVY